MDARREGSMSGRREPAGLARRGVRLAVAGLVLLCLLPGLARGIEELRFFRIGTAATTGTYFQIGGVLASAISKPPGSRDCEHGGSCGVPGLVAVAQATQGSVQNVLQVGAGQLESALVQSDVAYWGFTGSSVAAGRCRSEGGETGGTALLGQHGPIDNLRAIAALYPEDVHVVVRADGPVRSLADLRGRRVALGERESGTLADAQVVLEAAGLGECDLQAQYLRLSQAAEALARDEIDAFFMVAGYPVPAVLDVAALTPIRLLPMPEEVWQRIAAKYPFFRADIIPSGTYPGLDRDVPTVSVTSLWIVRSEVPDDLVYAITRALWRDATRRMLEGSHPVGRRIRIATALDGVPIPLHPGAARYYEELGIPLPDGMR
jgi:TRAP transporter TAXI family solute receptor